MLVLTRKTGESVRLGTDVTITVLEISGSTVRLGIDAPQEVPVHREEVWAAQQGGERPTPGGQADA